MATIDNLSIQVSSSVDGAIDALNRLASRLNAIQSTASRFSMTNVCNELNRVRDGATEASNAVNRLARAFEHLNRASGGFNGRGFSSSMRGVARDTDSANTSLTRFVYTMEQASTTFNSFGGSGRGGGGFTGAFQPLLTGQVGQIFTEFVDDLEEVESHTDDATGATNRFADAFRNFIHQSGDLSGAFSKLKSGLSGIAKAFSVGFGSSLKALGAYPKFIGGALVDSVKKAINSFHGLFASIQRIAFYRAIRSAIKYITAGFKEGMENLYNWSNAVNKNFANTMDSLATSSQYLKNSLAAMASPLITALAPAIDFVVEKLVDMFNLVNQFFSLLSGKTTYTAAKKVATVWNDATQKTKKGAKEAADEIKKTILAFDEINKLNDPNKSSSGTSDSTSGTPAVDYSNMFEVRPIENQINGLMDKLKGIWSVFQQAWAQEGAATIAAARAAFNSLKNAALDIGHTFYDVFTSGYGFAWVTSGLHLLQSLLGVVTSISESFRSAWNDDNRGFEYVTSIFTMLTNVNELIASVNRSFDEAFSSPIGQKIWENLLEIMTNVHNIIGNLAESLNKAWTSSGIGTAIWMGLLAIVNTVLDAVNGISEAVANWAANLDFKPLLSAFSELPEVIEPVVDTISNGLLWAYENVLLPVGKWTIEKGLPGALTLLSAAFGFLSSVLDVLKEPAQFIWDNFLEPVGKWVADTAIDAINGLSGALGSISTWIDEHKEGFETVTKLVGTFITSWLGASAVQTIIGGIATVLTSLSGALPLVAGGFTTLLSAINPVHAVLTLLIWVGTLVVANWDAISAKLSEVAGTIKENVDEVLGNIKQLWEDFTGWVAEIENNITSGLTTFQGTMSTIWEDVKTGAGEAWKWLKDGLSGLVTWVKTTFQSGWRIAWNAVIRTFGNLFAKIKDKVKGPINSAIKLINSMIGAVEGGINTIIGGINTALDVTIPPIGFTDPIWGNWVGTPEIRIDVPDLPQVKWGRVKELAKGGILTQPTYLRKDVIAGESGREAVLPLDQNTEWMDVLVEKVRTANSDDYMIAEYIRAGMHDATYQQNELLREQNRILQQLLEKPFTAEVSTKSIVNGLTRKNKRDGVTVVPVLG